LLLSFLWLLLRVIRGISGHISRGNRIYFFVPPHFMDVGSCVKKESLSFKTGNKEGSESYFIPSTILISSRTVLFVACNSR